MKTLLIIKSIIYCQTVHVFGPFTDACCKKCMAYLLTIFCFRSMPDGNKLPVQFSIFQYLSLVGDNSVVHEFSDGSCWAIFKCNIICPTSCIEISLWKLFSSYIRQCLNLHTDRVFETPKQVPWVAAFIEVLVQKGALAWPYVRMGYLHYFYVFSHYHQF